MPTPRSAYVILDRCGDRQLWDGLTVETGHDQRGAVWNRAVQHLDRHGEEGPDSAAGAQSQLVAQPEAYEVPPIRIVRRGGDGGSAWTSIAGDWP